MSVKLSAKSEHVSGADASIPTASVVGSGRRVWSASSAAIAYTATSLLQRLAGFLVLPIVAALVGPSGFGKISLTTSIALVATYALPLGQDVLVTRSVTSGAATEEQLHQIRVSLGVMLGIVGVGLVSALFVAAVAGDLWLLTLLEISSAVLIAGATTVPLAAWRGTRSTGSIARLLLATTLVQSISRLCLLAIFGDHVWVWGVGSCAGAAIAIFYAAPWLRRHVGRVSAAETWSAAREGAGFLPHQLAAWGLSVADRIVLATLVTSAAVGIYSLSYQMCAVLGTMFAEANRAALPAYGLAARDDQMQRMARVQAWGTVTFGGLAAAVAPIVLPLILPAKFEGGTELSYPLIVGMVALGLYYPCANSITMRHAKAARISLGTCVALVVNIVLNIVFVPEFGLMAAAWATAGAYAALLVAALLMAARSIQASLTAPAVAAGAVSGTWFLLHQALGLPPAVGGTLLLAIGLRGLLRHRRMVSRT